MSAALDKFRNKAQAAPAGGQATGKKKNRWAGVKSAQDRDPFPMPGTYVFRVVDVTVLTENGETYRATLEVVETDCPTHKAGDRVVFLQKLDGQSWRAGGPQVKRFTMSVVGLEDEAAFDAADPDGKLIDAGSGDLNDEYPENPLVGRLVACVVTKGKDVPEGGGDFYRNYKWAAIEEQ